MKFPLTLVPIKVNFNFLALKHLAFAVSILITIATFIGLYTKGLNLGIDFKGGIIIEIESDKKLDAKSLRTTLADISHQNSIIQIYDSKKASIRLNINNLANNNYQEEISIIQNALIKNYGKNLNFTKIDYVGPRISEDLVGNSIKAFVAALAVMTVYIWVRFNLKFGICALISLFHDIVATIGFFILTRYEFNLTSIAAILTVVGYSINDSVVIYDRIREKIRKYKTKISDKLINNSINETLSRTTMTFLTTFLASMSVGFFGGENLKSFGMAISFGIAFGTYSSIFISTSLLPYFNKGTNQKTI